jgi:phospholipid transport system substrate-binding protein
MMQRTCFAWIILMCSLTLNAQAATNTDAARQVIQQAMDEVISVLKDKGKPTTERQQSIEQIAYARFDFERMSKLVLAKNFKSMSDAQKDGFAQEFKKHLSLTYGRRLDAYSNEKIEVGAAREEKNGDVSVKTRVLGGSADGVEIEYRLRQDTGEWRVIDVIIEGVSLIANFRSQVQDIIRAEGADKLIEKLHQKNVEKAAKPSATSS